MKALYVVMLALLIGGPLSACDTTDGKKVVSESEVAGVVADAKKAGIALSPDAVREALGKDGCNIVVADGIAGADPHVILARDTTPANDAARYYKGLAAKSRMAIESAFSARAMQSFVCVGGCEKQKACSKKVMVSYGSGHLPKLNKDVFIVQSERSCQCN